MKRIYESLHRLPTFNNVEQTINIIDWRRSTAVTLFDCSLEKLLRKFSITSQL